MWQKRETFVMPAIASKLIDRNHLRNLSNLRFISYLRIWVEKKDPPGACRTGLFGLG